MGKRKVMLSIFLVAVLFLSPVYGFAQGNQPQPVKPKSVFEKPDVAMTNKNGNKLFDNLEEKLQGINEGDKLPVIVKFDRSQLKGKAADVLQQHIGIFQTKYEYSIIDGFAATLTKKQIEMLDKIPFINQVEYDGEVKASLATANQWFGTTKAKADFGLTGDGDGNVNSYSKNDIVIAVIDTGIDGNHKDLNNGKVIGWKDYVKGKTTPYDDNGHGTHVASIAADFSSRGYTADGRIKPDIAAPGYNITAAKANTTTGYITYSGTSMATPFTAGTVALMLDANPSQTPTQVKNNLYNTALDWGPTRKDIDYGNGRLDGYAAIKSAGGFSGTNIIVPNHFYKSGSLTGTGTSNGFNISVNNTGYPIAVTFIIPDWTSSFFSTYPDFDIYVYNPSGTLVASSEGTKRQETITFTPTTTGTYQLRVYSYNGSGSYFFDVSAGATSVN
ncbi:S8 family serine peptidase [Microaerobacter geothermalis]|uniref:S8 family serine peptidase n=1 Tax=Microaerobacter geothermalis TaxID=674972 RepID=UPI001F3F1539|nr:S8 family serine peptidase [Microaerobacter geothermalis]MCF6094290.1 S8 family serine peptidase [Microaerobacter geothermalis]